MGAKEIIELLAELSQDNSISRNIRAALTEIKDSLEANESEFEVKVNAALQKVEDLSLDPNISPYGRERLWTLTSMLENAVGEK